jgi:hypothetical protein
VRVNSRKHHKKQAGWIWKESIKRCMISPSAVIAKKSLLEKYGLFDTTFMACEDYDLWLKITRQHPVGLDPFKTLIKYGGHSDQLSKKYPAMDKFRVKSLLREFKKEQNDNCRKIIQKTLKQKLVILINGAKKRNRLKELEQYQTMLNQCCIDA